MAIAQLQLEETSLVSHIAGGCSLSPLLAAIYLLPLNEWAREHKIDYVRYMDDVVILTKTRHQIKRGVNNLYRIIQ